MAEKFISAQLLEQMFVKEKKRFMTLRRLRDALPAEERKRLGLTTKSEPQEIAPLLNNLSAPYAVTKKGKTSYVIGTPLEDLLETLIVSAGQNGKTLGRAAQSLPVAKYKLIPCANQLLDMGRVRAQITPDEKVRLYAADPARMAAAPKSESPAPKPPAMIGDPVAALKAAYDDLAVGKNPVYVYELRRWLRWPRQEFDLLLDRLLTEGRMAGFPGDPSRLSSDQIKDSFQGRDGEIYIAVAWRR